MVPQLVWTEASVECHVVRGLDAWHEAVSEVEIHVSSLRHRHRRMLGH